MGCSRNAVGARCTPPIRSRLAAPVSLLPDARIVGSVFSGIQTTSSSRERPERIFCNGSHPFNGEMRGVDLTVNALGLADPITSTIWKPSSPDNSLRRCWNRLRRVARSSCGRSSHACCPNGSISSVEHQDGCSRLFVYQWDQASVVLSEPLDGDMTDTFKWSLNHPTNDRSFRRHPRCC
jgi:hypothetical protein